MEIDQLKTRPPVNEMHDSHIFEPEVTKTWIYSGLVFVLQACCVLMLWFVEKFE